MFLKEFGKSPHFQDKSSGESLNKKNVNQEVSVS